MMYSTACSALDAADTIIWDALELRYQLDIGY